MIAIRQMTQGELADAAAIDVSEDGTIVYKWIDGKVTPTDEEWHRPPWSAPEWDQFAREWAAVLEQGGAAISAYDGPVLAGIAVLRRRLTADMDQLYGLFVSRAYRRHGIARMLTAEVVRLARAGGARRLYVSATPSVSAVGFYTSQGFVPTQEAHPELYEREPEDIHTIRAL